jgi:hypothetical protein
MLHPLHGFILKWAGQAAEKLGISSDVGEKGPPAAKNLSVNSDSVGSFG